MSQKTSEMKTVRIRPDASGFTVAAGQTVVNSDIIDTAGYEGVRFILGMGAITGGGVQSCKVQQNSANSGTGMADLEGSNVAIADDDDNQIVVIDVHRPRDRYLRVTTSRATQNSAIDFLVVELYNPRKLPADTADASVVATEKHASPVEGTA